MTLDGLLEISTRKGAYFVGAQQDVYVHAGFGRESGKDITLRKKGGDLNVGDLVLLHAQSIDVPLEDVKRDLDGLSPQYHRARHTVLTVTEDGQEIPKFREHLLQGLAAKTGITYDESKVLKKGEQDYTSAEYSKFADSLQETLPEVPRSRLLTWLHGQVVAQGIGRSLIDCAI